MNMIGTGGYGGSSYDKFADIDWSKNKHIITFKVEIFTLNFGVATSSSEFNINTYNKTFKMNTYTHNFNTQIQDIKFKVGYCST